MAKKAPTKGKTVSLCVPVGAAFSLVDRRGRGWQLDVQIPGYGRVRPTVAREGREDARREAIEIIENIERGLTAAQCGVPPVRDIATDMLVWKLAEQQRAETYVKAMASHLRLHILAALGEDTSLANVTGSHSPEVPRLPGIPCGAWRA